jgi:hypothetical protein
VLHPMQTRRREGTKTRRRRKEIGFFASLYLRAFALICGLPATCVTSDANAETRRREGTKTRRRRKEIGFFASLYLRAFALICGLPATCVTSDVGGHPCRLSRSFRTRLRRGQPSQSEGLPESAKSLAARPCCFGLDLTNRIEDSLSQGPPDCGISSLLYRLFSGSYFAPETQNGNPIKD